MTGEPQQPIRDRHESHDIIRGTGSVGWAPGHPTEEDLAKAKAWAEAHAGETGSASPDTLSESPDTVSGGEE